LALCCGVFALAWLAAGCRGTGSAPDTAVAGAPLLEPTAAGATATREATPEPKPTAMIAAAGPDTCTDCHTDKDLLIDTADPVEEVVSENEGEG